MVTFRGNLAAFWSIFQVSLGRIGVIIWLFLGSWWFVFHILSLKITTAFEVCNFLVTKFKNYHKWLGFHCGGVLAQFKRVRELDLWWYWKRSERGVSNNLRIYEQPFEFELEWRNEFGILEREQTKMRSHFLVWTEFRIELD